LNQILPSLLLACRQTNLFITHQEPLLEKVTIYFKHIIEFLILARKHSGRSKIGLLLKGGFSNDFDEALKKIEKIAQEIAKELELVALEGVPLPLCTRVTLLIL
jgi:hypothetical protein